MVTNIRTLRSSTKEILRTVARGETVWITNRGETCAKIVRVSESPMKTPKDEAFGMWKNRKDIKNPSEYVKNLRKQWKKHVI